MKLLINLNKPEVLLELIETIEKFHDKITLIFDAKFLTLWGQTRYGSHSGVKIIGSIELSKISLGYMFECNNDRLGCEFVAKDLVDSLKDTSKFFITFDLIVETPPSLRITLTPLNPLNFSIKELVHKINLKILDNELVKTMKVPDKVDAKCFFRFPQEQLFKKQLSVYAGLNANADLLIHNDRTISIDIELGTTKIEYKFKNVPEPRYGYLPQDVKNKKEDLSQSLLEQPTLLKVKVDDLNKVIRTPCYEEDQSVCMVENERYLILYTNHVCKKVTYGGISFHFTFDQPAS